MPTKDKHKTDVLFLWESPDDKFSDVFAYFPNEKYYAELTEAEARPYNFDLHMRSCYAHIGQHSACHPDYAKECREASPEEFKDLMEELESIGYNLNILNI